MMASLMASGIIAMTLGAYLNLVGHRNLAVMRSLAWKATMPAIEAGLEEALTQCYFHYKDTNLGANNWTLIDGSYTKTRRLGETYYEVAISAARPPVITCHGYAMLPLQTNYISRVVQIKTRADYRFSKAITVKGAIDLNGNDVVTDSFDSEDPSHSNDGLYDSTKRKDNGDIASISGLGTVISGGNANIYGRAATGPGGRMTIGPRGAVGSSAWQASNAGIQEGWLEDDMNIDFPDVELPFSIPGWPVAAGEVGGESYDYLLGAGNYQMVSLDMSGTTKMIVTNNAVLYVSGNISLSGQASVIIAPGASLTIYCAGASADFSGNGLINNTGSAFNFSYYGLNSNTSVAIKGNSSWAGTLYAPYAAITTVGNGDFVGSILGAGVKMTGNGGFHYDEALGRSGIFRGLLVTSWNEI